MGSMQSMPGLANPLIALVSGENINRQTGKILREVGFVVEEEHLWVDIVRLFKAYPYESVDTKRKKLE